MIPSGWATVPRCVGSSAARPSKRGGASISQMGRFETELLSTPDNIAALGDLSGAWIDVMHRRKPQKAIVLDMDCSVSPTHSDQADTIVASARRLQTVRGTAYKHLPVSFSWIAARSPLIWAIQQFTSIYEIVGNTEFSKSASSIRSNCPRNGQRATCRPSSGTI